MFTDQICRSLDDPQCLLKTKVSGNGRRSPWSFPGFKLPTAESISAKGSSDRTISRSCVLKSPPGNDDIYRSPNREILKIQMNLMPNGPSFPHWLKTSTP